MTKEKAIRVGIKLKPLTLVIIYNLNIDEIQKRVRKIPLKDTNEKTPEQVLEQLLKRHSHTTLLKSINTEKILAILSRIPGIISKSPLISRSPSPSLSSASPVIFNEQIEKSELSQKSDDSISEKSEISEFEKEDSIKNETDEENDYLANLLKSKKRNLSILDSTASSISIEEESVNSDKDSESSNFGDLNGLADDELNEAKAKMDKNFNQLKPGDEGFEYDKRNDFSPDESCQWDSDN